jgi:hypothetical protein
MFPKGVESIWTKKSTGDTGAWMVLHRGVQLF